jgi:vancomycin resistance protein YoaR
VKVQQIVDAARTQIDGWWTSLRAPLDGRAWLQVGAVAVVGGVAGVLIVPGETAQALDGVRNAAPTITVAGEPLHGDPSGWEDEASGIVERYLGGEIAWKPPAVPGAAPAAGTPHKVSRSALGARLDSSRLAALVAEASDPHSALRRAHLQNDPANKTPIALPLPVTVDPDAALNALLEVKDDLDEAPHDATIDPDAKVTRPETSGRRVDVYATLAALDEALVKGDGEVPLAVEVVPAARTKEQLGSIDTGEILGWFETKYNRDQKHENRSFNLKLAASKLNGTVILPGETFDLNATVGPRNEANGYKMAPEIASGELVDGVGGGTCQIAGTLHGAAVFAGLDIVERHPHTRPSFYIKMGLDAAVAYPTVTLKLRNPFDFPVVLHETVKDGMVRAEILGKRRSRDVTFVRKIADVVPFEEKEVDDPKIPSGQRALAQRGIPGFKIVRYRIVREGAQAIRERSQDVYPSTMQIWHRGSGPSDPSYRSHDDEHPEYVADEYLAVTQGADIHSRHATVEDEPGGGMIESRVAGRYGTHGWMEREGFARGSSASAQSSSGTSGADRPKSSSRRARHRD